jgi:hypothetical protein
VDVVLPFQQFKYSVLGVSAACPGFLALFMKLNRPHFESYAQQYPHYLSDHKTLFHASALTANMNSLDSLPYLKSTGTEHSIYQVSVSSPLCKEGLSSVAQADGEDNEDNGNRNTNSNHEQTYGQPEQRHHRRQTYASKGGNSEENLIDFELSSLISQLPDNIVFLDFVSILFRLSHGDVVSNYQCVTFVLSFQTNIF